MSKLFKPKINMPPPPPVQEKVEYAPPSTTERETALETETTSATEADTITEQEAAQATVNKRKKKNNTILTGPQGLTTEAETYSPTLLG
tara:strand:+ start:336 stop:602 length:267 start_codon:yes stop_codon:yes gene_type:complete